MMPSWVSRFAGVPPPFPVYRPPAEPVYRSPWPWVLPPRSRPAKQRAAIALVNGTTGTAVFTTSGTINKPTGTVDGHFMILTLNDRSGISNPTLSGWNYINAPGNLHVFVRVANSEGASYTPTWTTNSNVVLTLTSWSGVDTSVSWKHAILAHKGWSVDTASPHPTAALYFQSCDHMLVSALSHRNTLAATQPTSWTMGPNTTQTDVRGSQAYRSMSATEGHGGTNWTTSGSGVTSVWVIALRASGETALGLKTARIGWQATASGTSVALTMPGEKVAGDLIVVLQASKVLTSGANIAFGTPTGYTKKGSDQFYNVTNKRMAGGVLFRLADDSGSDACTITAGATCSLLGAILIFGTGSAGDDPSLPGTMGQANDTSANTIADIPAMTLEDYAENNILVSYAVLDSNHQAGLVEPAGFVSQSEGGVGTNNVSGYAAVKMNGAANPAAHTWTSNPNFVSLGFQFAVGVVLEGSADPDVTGVSVTWVG